MHIYFSGIGGAGIGPLALLALDSGYQVSGSDVVHSWFIDELNERGAQITISRPSRDFLQEKLTTKNPPTWLVHTSALPSDYPELQLAAEKGLKATKRANFLLHLLKRHNLKLIAVSGTHGKTTTTGMMIWLAHELNIPVSYLIGTDISWGPNAELKSGSRWFIYEADEYDRNMLNFHPDIAVIPSLDYDHPDIYPTAENYLAAFSQFVGQSQVLLAHKNVADKFDTKPITTSIKSEELTLPGVHNRQNAILAISAFEQAGLSANREKLIRAVNSFPGTARRFEKLADNLYSDYAHHPNEIAATLQLASELSDSVVVVYQPHQDKRQQEVRDGYKDAFKLAKKIYWLPTYEPVGRSNQEPLTQAELVAGLNNNQDAIETSFDISLADNIRREKASGNLVLCFSAGTLDAFLRQNCLAD